MFNGSIIDELIATVTRIEQQEVLRTIGLPEVSEDLLFLATLDCSDRALLSGVA